MKLSPQYSSGIPQFLRKPYHTLGLFWTFQHHVSQMGEIRFHFYRLPTCEFISMETFPFNDEIPAHVIELPGSHIPFHAEM